MKQPTWIIKTGLTMEIGNLFKIWTLLILTGVAKVTGLCPANISMEVSTCLTQYNTFSRVITEQPTRLFTGVDVEVLRYLCATYRPATMCLTRLRIECPRATKQINAETDHMLILDELCSRRDLFDLYALQQNCYIRTSTISSQCYSDFRVKSDSNWVEAVDGRNKALKNVCRNYDVLVSCLKENIRKTCGHEATKLVSDLVMPAVKISHACLSLKITTPRPLKPRVLTSPTKRAYNKPNNSKYSINSAISTRIALTLYPFAGFLVVTFYRLHVIL
ncbi:uncharacterized protein LOC141902480 isoform X2 [Tubulanus polymorphus]|uniref:uncharacterized protein LOC141902480 isoform X2 n=1 Tax=Tubulanus polymorphus TaxID=672921 RepID=UPI003DA556AC